MLHLCFGDRNQEDKEVSSSRREEAKTQNFLHRILDIKKKIHNMYIGTYMSQNVFCLGTVYTDNETKTQSFWKNKNNTK